MSALPKEELKPSTAKLDLGCGPKKKEGFHGVDSIAFDGVDTVLNLVERKPRVAATSLGAYVQTSEPGPFKKWPWADDSVEEVHSSHFLEHLKADERIFFFNELHRVMKKDAKALVTVPHWSSSRAYGDLTHQWPPVVEMFWYYLDKTWRKDNAPHVPFECDFTATWGYGLIHPWNLRSQESQTFALTHYREVAQDMICTITARKA